MYISAASAHLKIYDKKKMIQVGLCLGCGQQGHIPRDCPEKRKTIQKGKYTNNPGIYKLNIKTSGLAKITHSTGGLTGEDGNKDWQEDRQAEQRRSVKNGNAWD